MIAPLVYRNIVMFFADRDGPLFLLYPKIFLTWQKKSTVDGGRWTVDGDWCRGDEFHMSSNKSPGFR